MNNNEQQLKDRILEKIKAQEVSMRPKLYFTLRIAALVVVAIAALAISIFILNFILFSIRINGHDALLGFGPRGFSAFLHFFPWPLLIADVALVFVLQGMLRQFRFGYKIPVLYLLAGLFGLTLVVGVVVDRGTGFNDDFLSRADHHEVFQPFGDFYEHARRMPPPGSGVCKCIIVSINGSTLLVRDTRSTTTLTVELPQNDPHATTSGLMVGDTIFVAGDVQDEVVIAFGVRKVSGTPEGGPSGW